MEIESFKTQETGSLVDQMLTLKSLKYEKYWKKLHKRIEKKSFI